MLTKQEILLVKGTRVESSRVKGTQENCSAVWLTVSGFMVMGLVSGGTRITQPRWMLARGILGSGRTRGISF